MAILEIAFATIATRSAHKDDTEYQVQLCEEKLGTLRNELSKAEQNLREITNIVMTLRRHLEFPGRDHNAMDGNVDVDPEEDFSAQADRLIRMASTMVATPKENRLESRSTLSSDTSDSHG